MKGFSKLIGVGYRIGAIAASEQIIDIITAAKSISDLGSPQLTQMAVSKILQSEKLEIELAKRREVLKHKKNILISAIEKYGKNRVKYTTPMGGLCLWLTFEKDIDCNKLLKKVREQQVNFLPGQIFFSSKYEKNHIRLTYYHMEESEIIEGVKRLFEVL